MAAIIRRLCCHRDAVAPTKDGDSAEAQPQLSDDAERDMSRSFKEHHMSVEDIGQLHSSSGINTADVQRSSGLTNKEAADRLVTFGRNSLPPPKELSNWRLLLKQFLNFFWLLLIGAGILSLITYALDTSVPMNLYVAFVLFAIVFIMCFIQFWEEKKARNAVQAFKKLLPVSCTVIRDSKEKSLQAYELVVGDLVQLRSGGRVPADLRVLYANGLKLETSSITGESEPSDYTSDAVDSNVSVFDSQNIAFNGSFVIEGEGIGVVIRTGSKTIIGRIASLTTDQSERKSTLQRELDHFVTVISAFAILMGLVIFGIGCLVNGFSDVLDTFINGFLIVIIACVPQGLPATVTTQLTIIARRMAKKHVFLKKLDVIESLGACTVIASDKTGTLTKNSMTVTDIWYDRHYMSGRPDIKHKTLRKRKFSKNPLEMYEAPLPQLVTVSIMCNHAQIVRSSDTVQKSVHRSVRRMGDMSRAARKALSISSGDPGEKELKTQFSMETVKEEHLEDDDIKSQKPTETSKERPKENNEIESQKPKETSKEKPKQDSTVKSYIPMETMKDSDDGALQSQVSIKTSKEKHLENDEIKSQKPTEISEKKHKESNEIESQKPIETSKEKHEQDSAVKSYITMETMKDSDDGAQQSQFSVETVKEKHVEDDDIKSQKPTETSKEKHEQDSAVKSDIPMETSKERHVEDDDTKSQKPTETSDEKHKDSNEIESQKPMETSKEKHVENDETKSQKPMKTSKEKHERDGAIQSQMSIETSKETQITGNPSEVALLRYTEQLVPSNTIKAQYKVVFELPFNSLRKTHLIIVKQQEGKDDKYELMMKGAPEMLIDMCSKIATENGDVDIDEDSRDDFQDAYDHFGNEGRRVIGFAHKYFDAPGDTKFDAESGNYPQDGLTFLGMAAIMDPPREDAALAIQQCKTAGIKVYMVTGDHPTTATAIARQIGLIGSTDKVQSNRKKSYATMTEPDDKDWTTVHGEDLGDMSSEEWDELLETPYIVFSRTTPEQKLLIVENCQKRGEIVAVTGDGVNDAPALKRADIGVAMGVTGSDVAKQAADIVLMDDNFASIVNGIEEGRLLFDNLKKSIAYTLTHFPPEGWPIIFRFALGLPPALSSLQVLSIDLGTEMAPAISMAYENSERDIMNKPPRKRTSRLVSWAILAYSYLFAGTILSIGSALAYFSVFIYHGIAFTDLFYSKRAGYFQRHASELTSNGIKFDEEQQLNIMRQASAAYHLTVVVSQAYHIWTCTTRRTSLFQHGIHNLVMVFGVLIELLLICLFVYMPGVRFIMGAEPPPHFIWLFSLVVGLVLLFFNEMRKYFIRKYPQNAVVRIFKW